MQKKPLLTISRAADELAISVPTVASALKHLEKLAIVREVTARPRDRLFAYNEYLAILERGITQN